LLRLLKEEGVQQVGEMQTFEYGKFAWIMDPEGNKIELWEPWMKLSSELTGQSSTFTSTGRASNLRCLMLK
jgi:hypothetical protein